MIPLDVHCDVTTMHSLKDDTHLTKYDSIYNIPTNPGVRCIDLFQYLKFRTYQS
jgi:hypothetical protein